MSLHIGEDHPSPPGWCDAHTLMKDDCGCPAACPHGEQEADCPQCGVASDDLNALRVIRDHGQELRFCTGLGWMHWSGTRWEMDSEEAARELAKLTFRSNVDPADRASVKQAGYALSAAGTTSALRQAQSDPRVRIVADALDRDPGLLNTPGGTVVLNSGKVRDHDPGHLLTRTTTVTPARMPTPQWMKFLNETFTSDPDLITYVQTLFGLSLYGNVREHLLPFLHGPGGNGKGVFTGVISRLLGDSGDSGYACTANEGLLTGKSEHPTEIARLRGARLLLAPEQDGKNPIAEARVKQLTGGDRLTGRLMRQDYFTFDPSHTLFVIGNELPPILHGGPSWWRRVRVIPFTNRPANPDPELAERLVLDEGPGILSWLIAGAGRYHHDGIGHTPTVVTAATGEYESSDDPLRLFVDSDLDLTGDNEDRVDTGTLLRRYTAWCKDMGFEPIGQRTLTARLTSEYGLTTGEVTTGGNRRRALKGVKWIHTYATDPT